MHISVGDLTPGRDRLTAAHVAVGEIVYPPGPKDPEPQVATLIYVKAGLTAGDPRDLHQYRAGNPSFPQQTTVDQFFDEAQFESYRELGYLSGVALGERLAAALR